jgi:hypothetical protein
MGVNHEGRRAQPGEAMSLRSWFQDRMAPDRFCPCGQERCVDAAARIDRRTGERRGAIWGVACPEIDLMFEADKSGQGNGFWNHGHTGEIDCFTPTWLAPEIRRFIEAEADAYGHCSRTESDWRERMLEKP